RVDSISGNVKLGADHFVKIDTLKGKIGRSDFDISMRLYTGKDTARMAKENFLQFTSRFLDVDQLSSYRFTNAEPDTTSLVNNLALSDSLASVGRPMVSTVASTSEHASAFNIFNIPFIDFRATVKIDKIKFQRLWVKNLFSNARMQANQHLYLDT